MLHLAPAITYGTSHTVLGLLTGNCFLAMAFVYLAVGVGRVPVPYTNDDTELIFRVGIFLNEANDDDYCEDVDSCSTFRLLSSSLLSLRRSMCDKRLLF